MNRLKNYFRNANWGFILLGLLLGSTIGAWAQREIYLSKQIEDLINNQTVVTVVYTSDPDVDGEFVEIEDSVLYQGSTE